MVVKGMPVFSQGFSADNLSNSAVSGQVLLVEDDPVVSLVLSDILISHGISVINATSGQDALAAFTQRDLNIHVVVMDYNVQGMHAQQILERLREINSSVRVVLASGYAKGDIATDLDLEDVDAFMPKPFLPQDLISTVSNLMLAVEQ